MEGSEGKGKEGKGGVGKRPSRACALAAAEEGSARGSLPASRLAGPHRPGPESKRVAPAQSSGPGGRLRTSVLGARAAGLLEVERGEGARQEAAAVTARAWSRGRWSPPPPPPPALFSLWSGPARPAPRAPGRD